MDFSIPEFGHIHCNSCKLEVQSKIYSMVGNSVVPDETALRAVLYGSALFTKVPVLVCRDSVNCDISMAIQVSYLSLYTFTLNKVAYIQMKNCIVQIA